MSHDILAIFPVPAEVPPQEGLELPPQVLGPNLPPPPPDAVQVQAVDDAFAQPEDGSALPAALALWSGSTLLADLAMDHLAHAEQEEKCPPRLPPREPEGEGA
jgi:hypothetical protein